MKKIIIIIAAVLMYMHTDAQTENDSLAPATKEHTGRPAIKLNIRTYGTLPTGIGDNIISKAYNGTGGVGIKVNIFSIYNVNVGVEYEYMGYTVSDPSLAGNTKGNDIHTPYLELLYELPVTRKLTVSPKIAIGSSSMQQKGKNNYGWQYGTTLRLGMYIDYSLNDYLAVFLTGNYLSTRFNVKTNSEYKDFFSKVQQVNAGLGLKVTIIK